MGRTIRVALADNHALSRAGLGAWLQDEAGIDVVYETDSCFSLIDAINSQTFDVAVIKLPPNVMSIYYPLAYISRHNSHTRVLVHGHQNDDETILRISKAGAAGLISSESSRTTFIDAIRRVEAGEAVFSVVALRALLDASNSSQAQGPDPIESLSEREYEVLIRTAQGQSRQEISYHCSISPRTVDTYRQRIATKLNLDRRTDIMRYAIQRGLVDVPDDQIAAESIAVRRSPPFEQHNHLPSNSELSWDEEFDVIVVGSGIGMISALKAADAGLNVLVLEKEAVVGGTTALSGGGLWVPNNYCMQEAGIADSAEQALTYLQAITSGKIRSDLAQAFIEHCHNVIDLCRSIGISWRFNPSFNDYYPEFPGGVDFGRTIMPIHPEGDSRLGKYLLDTFYEGVIERGGQVWVNSTAKRLAIDDDRRVKGVVAEVDGIVTHIKARRGVVLASGGFDHNKVMADSFLRGPLYYSSAAKGNTGDGQIMGMAVGAGIGHMNERWGWPVYFDPQTETAHPALANELGKPGAIVVNRIGQRIMNEAGPYDLVTRAFYAFDSGRFEYSNIPAFVICDTEHRKRADQVRAENGQSPSNWFIAANTLETLASELGINATNLIATVDRFNEYAEAGHDPDFRRGESVFDIQTGGDLTRDDLLNPCLGPLMTPPFYGASIWPGALGTSGGLRVNANSQVLDVWGKPIQGLYAAGNTAANPFAGSYPGGGGTLSVGMTFAYLAAAHLISHQVDIQQC